MASHEAVQATVSIGTLLVLGLDLFGVVGVVAGAVGVGLKRKWGLYLSAVSFLGPTLVGVVFTVVAILLTAVAAPSGDAGALSSEAMTYAMGPTHVGCPSMCVSMPLFVIVGWLTYYHFGEFGKTKSKPWR